MERDKITAALEAAREFIARSVPVLKDYGTYESGGYTFHHSPSPKDTGAFRRSSLELTRALAEMRKP